MNTTSNPKPRVCLNMIVKDEAHIILETLESVCKYICYWIIVDTGSTDDTMNIIKNYFKDKNIPGELYQDKWIDNFGHSRSFALRKTWKHKKFDYAWVIDADDVVCGDLDFSFISKNPADAYELRIGGGSSYQRLQIFSTKCNWKYECYIHEFPYCLGKESPQSLLIPGDYYINSRRLGNRSKNEHKMLRDAELCLKGIEKDPKWKARYTFYAAQSYFDYKDFSNALKYYKKRSYMKDYDREVFYSLYKMGKCKVKLEKSQDEIIASYLDAFKHSPHRVEPLYDLSLYFMDKKDYNSALIYLNKAESIKLDIKKDNFFVEIEIYNYQIKDAIIDCLYFLGKEDESISKINDFISSEFFNTLDGGVKKNFEKKYIYLSQGIKLKEYSFEGYDFIPNKDSADGDVAYSEIDWSEEDPLGDIKRTCDSTVDILAFNTYGYVKSKLVKEDKYITLRDQPYAKHGIYIKKEGYTPQILKSIEKERVKDMNKEYKELPINKFVFEDYDFIPNRDYYGGDITNYTDKSIEELKQICDSTTNSEGFNTYGYVKGTIGDVDKIILNLKHESDGIYVKKNRPVKVEYSYDLDFYNKDIVNSLSKQKSSNIEDLELTLTITSCKRFDLFQRTINSFLNCCLDIHLIKEFICVDDNSSEEDRMKMKELYPFFTFIFKGPSQKGHIKSMNIIQDIVKTKYLLHLEDDFLFCYKYNYIQKALQILNQDSIIKTSQCETLNEIRPENIAQVLFNRNYVEVDERQVYGGFLCKTKEGDEYIIHQHVPQSNKELYEQVCQKYKNSNCVYWPHYSFRPSILKTEIFREIGKFRITKDQQFFEREYADRYYEKGYRSCFFNMNPTRHIGKLTSEKDKKNAYDLNNESQFDKVYSVEYTDKKGIIKILNLERRKDRKENMEKIFGDVGLTNYSFYPAIDGTKLKLTQEIIDLFRGNDFGNRKATIGCALSHYNMWREFIESDNDFICIFEDDIKLNENFRDRFIQSIEHLKQNYDKIDILFLGYLMYDQHLNKYLHREKKDLEIGNLNNTFYIGGFASYILTRSGAEKLLEYIKENGIKHGIDYLVKINDNLRRFETRPHLAIAEWVQNMNSNVDSDIQKNFESFDFDNEFADEIQRDWIFFQGYDYNGHDIKRVSGNIRDIFSEVKKCDNAKAFNTLGYIKDEVFVDKLGETPWINKKTNHGIYIRK